MTRLHMEKALADQMKMAMEKRGKKADMYEAITAGEKDYTALVTKMKAAKIEYAYLAVTIPKPD